MNRANQTLEVKFELVYGKIILCQKHIVRKIPYHIINFLESSRQIHHCSLSFLHKLLSLYYLNFFSLFSHKTPSEIVFLNLNAKSECFFMFKFHNNRICFSALIKSISMLIKFALYISCLLYIRICLLHSYKSIFCIK